MTDEEAVAAEAPGSVWSLRILWPSLPGEGELKKEAGAHLSLNTPEEGGRGSGLQLEAGPLGLKHFCFSFKEGCSRSSPHTTKSKSCFDLSITGVYEPV